MKTNKLTEASMLSALFIVISIIALGSGIGYSIYLDVLVPIIAALIYFKCDFKYSVMSIISSLVIVFFVIGDVASGIFMIQGIVIGIGCGIIINRDESIYDDLVLCSILACIFMIFIDLYFRGFTGVSFLEEFKSMAESISDLVIIQNVIYYMLTIALPMGTVLCTNLGAILFGKKLNILSENAQKKFLLISNFKKYGSFLCCSKKVIYMGIIYIFFAELFNYFNVFPNYLYLNTTINILKYVLLYFILEDSYTFMAKYIYSTFHSRIIVNVTQLVTLVLIVFNFKLASILLISLNIVINKKFNLRNKQFIYISNSKLENKNKYIKEAV